jgi:cytochrome c oxidase subunit III
METVQHQFDTAEQQQEAATLGMWVFLATEVLFFGGMFLAYAVYRSMYPAAFAEASHHLDVVMGTINTAVLLCSSLTMALAVQASQLGNIRSMVRFLLITMVFGAAFIGIKFVEYYHKYEEALIPGANFSWSGENPGGASLFFVGYFVMTGMHALHMVIGLGIMAGLIWFARKGRYSTAYFTPVELSGLYWHFVDIVWVFLFPMLYLIDRSQ